MKKIYFILIVFVTIFFSCSEELDQNPISSATTETFYKSTEDFIQGVNAIYASLRTYPDRQLNLSETRSDNLYAVSDGGVRDWEGINSFHKTIADNTYISEAWLGNFNGIFKANTVLGQIQKNGSIITNTTLRSRLKAEARFLRAFYYFDLVRWFGKAPVADHALTAEEASTIPRSPVSDVYDFIIEDLQFACDSLLDENATADIGRATKYAAKGLLALVYMTRSGPTYDIEGPGLGLNEWSQAAALLDEIIGNTNYSFLSDYASIFSYSNENNAEVIFDVQYITGSSPVLGATFPWVLAPDEYFKSEGKAVQGGLTIRPVSNDLLNTYETGDIRKSFSVQPGYVYNSVAETRSFFVKYVDLTKVPSNRLDWPINFIVLRYTDVLMLKAECILHGAPGTQAEVDAVVNQVRNRAGLTTTLSDVTLTQLMEERRTEFAAEGLRWHDLVRSGLVETVMTAWIPVEDTQNQMKAFKKEYIIYPIPQSEMDVVPGLYDQNDEY